MKCPDCGADIVLPDAPGPIECDCEVGWYLMGHLIDDPDTDAKRNTDD